MTVEVALTPLLVVAVMVVTAAPMAAPVTAARAMSSMATSQVVKTLRRIRAMTRAMIPVTPGWSLT